MLFATDFKIGNLSRKRTVATVLPNDSTLNNDIFYKFRIFSMLHEAFIWALFSPEVLLTDFNPLEAGLKIQMVAIKMEKIEFNQSTLSKKYV